MRSLGTIKRDIEALDTRTGFLKKASWFLPREIGGVHRGVGFGRGLIAFNSTLLMRLGTLRLIFNQNQSQPSWGRGFRIEETLLRDKYPRIEITNDCHRVFLKYLFISHHGMMLASQQAKK